MAEKQRLDLLLVERGLETSRERAKAVIMSGVVYVNNQKADKAGLFCGPDDQVEVRGPALQYVSRGGLKIEKALDYFAYDPAGQSFIDIGASTGGFTDCLLRRGAAQGFAVDVGYGQLAWQVRTDPRVTVMERTNIRNVKPEDIGQPLDLAVCDVSFISLRLVLPVARSLLGPQGHMLTLVKPQFEAGREKVGKKGVVRDPNVHLEVLERFLDHAAQGGFAVKGLDFSPIRGPEGNIEYLGFLQAGAGEDPAFDLKELVERSHQALKG